MRGSVFRVSIGAAAAIAVCGASVDAAAGESFSRRLHPLSGKIRLDAALTEVSGLADAGDGRLYAHDDEHGVVFELEATSGRISGKIAFGEPPISGDFEAVAVQSLTLSLITSAGVIHSVRIDDDRTYLKPAVRVAKLGGLYEIEAFAVESDDSFFIACKEAKKKLVVYRWSAAVGARLLFEKKLDALAPNPREFRAADMVFDKETKTLLILDSGDGALLEVTLSGESAGYWRLGGRHQQAEGLALLASGEIIVADEGKTGKRNSKRAYLTVYPPRR